MSDDALSLFEAVCARSGLAAMIGPGTVQRALSSVGISSPTAAHPGDYLRALPFLKQRMAIYLSPAEVERNARQIEELLASGG